MTIDLNKLAVLLTVIVLAALAVTFGYRLEIGAGGLTLEKSERLADEPRQLK